MDKLSPENQWRKITAGEFGAVYEAFYCGVPVALKVCMICVSSMCIVRDYDGFLTLIGNTTSN